MALHFSRRGQEMLYSEREGERSVTFGNIEELAGHHTGVSQAIAFVIWIVLITYFFCTMN
jgi:hypothetical protein